MKFYIEIITPMGMFKGEILEGSSEQYELIKNGIKEVFKDEIFDVDLQDGSYLTMNNNLIQQSIFRVVKVNN